ncbi:alpha-acetolactate decarboxylase [Paraburkholderia unamae]|uniref:Alpha-acetolactate decarboxylase n=2 Tax=Paraburkholderia unamae TaxID=219649 RepID=A0ABX5KUJ2_9BURK|nr:alpha-acetolactate decarboxylase [Paraburkholderia unamae]
MPGAAQEQSVWTAQSDNVSDTGVFLDVPDVVRRWDSAVKRTQWPEPVPPSFAAFAEFDPLIDVELPPARSLGHLRALCDTKRPSSNVFYALRLDGVFRSVRIESMEPTPSCRSPARVHGCEWTNVAGTVVGLWTPGVSSVFSLPGYHFQFFCTTRRRSGRLVARTSPELRLRMEPLGDFIWHCLRSQSLQT